MDTNPTVEVVQDQESEVTCGRCQEKAVISNKSTASEDSASLEPVLYDDITSDEAVQTVNVEM